MYKLTLVVLMSVVLSAYANRVRQLSGYGYEAVKPTIQMAPVAPVAQSYSSYSSYGSSSGLQSSFIAEPNPCLGHLAGDKLVYSLSSTKYIHCEEEGEWKIMDCPSLLVFNPDTLRCENTLRTPKGCLSNPCLNGGRCVDLPLFQWRCDCPTGFAGDFCEKTDGCLVDSCGATGICFPLPAGAPVTKYCVSADLSIVGIDLVSSFESNPCLTNDMELKTFPSKTNQAVFVHCEGNIPHLKFCQYPLIYNHLIQDCDWSEPQEQAKITLEAPSSNYGYSQQIAEPAPLPAPVQVQSNYGYSQKIETPAPAPVIRRPVEPVPEQSYGYGQKIETPAPVLIRETPVQQPTYGQQVFKPVVRQPVRRPAPLKQTLKSSGY